MVVNCLYPRWPPTKSVGVRVCRSRGRRLRTTVTAATRGHRCSVRRPNDMLRCRTSERRNGQRIRHARRPNWLCRRG